LLVVRSRSFDKAVLMSTCEAAVRLPACQISIETMLA